MLRRAGDARSLARADPSVRFRQ